MRGIQTLIDKYLKEKKFRDYNFAPLATSADASTVPPAAALPEAMLPTEVKERKTTV